MPYPYDRKSDRRRSDRIELAGNQLYQFHACAGTELVVDDGSADIIDVPVWLGGGVNQGIRPVVAGDRHRVEQTGYIGIKARTWTQVTITVPQTPPSLLSRLSAALPGMLRGSWRALNRAWVARP